MIAESNYTGAYDHHSQYPDPSLRGATRGSSSGHNDQMSNGTVADLSKLDWLFASNVQIDPADEYTPHPAEQYKQPVQLPAPDSFALSQVKEWSEPGPEVTVINQPVRLYRSPRVFEIVDSHALEVVATDHDSFKDLMWHLIYAKEITHDLEKARAIFVWLCCKNPDKITFGDKVLEGSQEEVIKDLNGGKTTVASAFDLMCRYAGLQSKRVVGYAKTGPNRPGERNKHVWNAVQINGNWCLMEVMWAGTKLKKQEATLELVQRDLDEFLFCSPPHEFIFTHFPDDPLWQLLPQPLTLDEFDNTVHVKSAFTRLGLRVLSHRQAVIQAGPRLTITVGSPQNRNIAFICKLATVEGKEEINGVPLSRYIFQQTVDLVTTFDFRIPAKGSYVFTIYAKDANSGRKDESFGGVAIYLIDSEGNDSDYESVTPFPPCTHSRYGPTEKAANYDLKPQHSGFILHTVKGRVELQFKLPERDLSFMAKLKSNSKDDKELNRYTMFRVVNGVVIFSILAPSIGEFGLEIYCRDIKVDGTSLFHVYQYLVICNELENGSNVEPLPALTPGYLGPQAGFAPLGLSTVTHYDPYIETETGNMDVIFCATKPLRMSSQLLHLTKDQQVDSSEYILQQRQGDRVIFKLRLCQTGWYKLQFFGLPVEDSSESLPGIFNYIINCTRASESQVPYPKQYSPWKEGCFLHAPLDGKLVPDPEQKPISFVVEIPKTSSVAVVIGKEWNQLALKPSGFWEGDVNMEKHWGGAENKAKLCAKLESGDNYGILLEYSL